VSSPDEQLAEVVGESERKALTAALGQDILRELGLILAGCELSEARSRIVNEVLQAAPEFGDRAVMVALARVAYDNDPEGRTENRDVPDSGGEPEASP
jgi:hypothetical protein